MIVRSPSGSGHPSSVHLSVVATSRNDDHGGGLLRRMKHFVDGLVEQSRRHRLSVELILVDWNPPPDRPPLADALRWPTPTPDFVIRIVTVPPSVHGRLAHGDQLPLFQMIAKNVGIRRARGRYVLATNVDILFSDSMIRYLRDDLVPGRLYRADRCDVPTDVPDDAPLDQILQFCEQQMFRINTIGRTLVKTQGRWRQTPSLSEIALRHLQELRRRARAIATGYWWAGRSLLARIWRSLANRLQRWPRRSRAAWRRGRAWCERATRVGARAFAVGRRVGARWGRAWGSARVRGAAELAVFFVAVSRIVTPILQTARPRPHVTRWRQASHARWQRAKREGVLATLRSVPRWAWYRTSAAGRLIWTARWPTVWWLKRFATNMIRKMRAAVALAAQVTGASVAAMGRAGAWAVWWTVRLSAQTAVRLAGLTGALARWTLRRGIGAARRMVRAMRRTVRVMRRTAQGIRTWTTRAIRAVASSVARGGARAMQTVRRRREVRLFTNACGDFTLLSRDDWFALRGYPEWEIFSWHVDSVLLHQANRSGIREVYAGRQRRIFHIEHGTGYSPEGVTDMFARLDAKGIPYITWPGFLSLVADMEALRQRGQRVIYNRDTWGLADEALPEHVIGDDDDDGSFSPTRWRRSSLYGRRG